MLSLTVKEKEFVVLSNGVAIYISRIRGGSVQVSVRAPDDVVILRGKFVPDWLKDKIRKGTDTPEDVAYAFKQVELAK